MILPFKGLFVVTQGFGVNPERYKQFLVMYPDGIRRPMRGHNGWDFATPHRTEIVAPHSGVIKEALFDKTGYGWYVKIENEEEGSVIAHLDSVDVKQGYQLQEGDHIGWSDNTGNSTGSHCHWGYYKMPRDRANGIAGFIDQLPFLKQVGIELAVGKLPTIQAGSPAAIIQDVTEVNYYGLDPKNIKSVQTVYDTWHDVANNKYKTAQAYRELEIQLEAVKKQLENTQKADSTVSSDLKNYNEMVALGYNTLDDITKRLEEKDATNLSLQQENTRLLKRIDVLAGEIQKDAQEDHTTAELGQKALSENEELKKALVDVAKAAGVDKVSSHTIISKVFNLKDLADRFIKKAEAEQKARTPQVTKEVTPVQVDNLQTPVKASGINFLLQLFQLIPTEKGGEQLEK